MSLPEEFKLSMTWMISQKKLAKLAFETALNAELTQFLGYEKHQNSPKLGIIELLK